MRILHLHERTEVKGGAEVYIKQLHNLLPEYGHQSFWIGQDSLGKNPENSLNGFLTKNRIDVISVHNIFDSKLVAFCLDRLPVVKFSHSPVIVCPGGEKFWRYSQKPCEIKYGLHCFKHIYTEGCANRHPKRVLKAWKHVNFEIKNASKRYGRIIVMSEYIKEGLLECGIDENKILCNPYFTEPLDYRIPGKNLINKRLLFIGRLAPSKGPHLLIKMFAELLKKDNNFVLDIVGDGIMFPELKALAEDLHIEDKVFFHGWLNRKDVNAMLIDCFLLVFPSIYPEAFGIAGIEAMMHSKPVVGFDSGGVSTWLQTGVTGYLVKPADINEMSERIFTLIKQPDLYNLMCKNANMEALRKYSPNIHVSKLLTAYAECLNVK